MYTLGSLTASNYQLTAHPYHEVSVFCAKAAHVQMDNLPTRLWMPYLYFNAKLYEIKAKPCSQAKHIFFPLKLLLRLGDYQACRRYTFQLYIHSSANPTWAYSGTRALLPLQHGSRCSDPARRRAAPAALFWPADFAGPEQDSTSWRKWTQEKSPTNKPLWKEMQDN